MASSQSRETEAEKEHGAKADGSKVQSLEVKGVYQKHGAVDVERHENTVPCFPPTMDLKPAYHITAKAKVGGTVHLNGRPPGARSRELHVKIRWVRRYIPAELQYLVGGEWIVSHDHVDLDPSAEVEWGTQSIAVAEDGSFSSEIPDVNFELLVTSGGKELKRMKSFPSEALFIDAIDESK